MATPKATSDVVISDGPTDTVSELCWSAASDHLAVASWDCKLRLYDINDLKRRKIVSTVDFTAPILSCHWSEDGKLVVGAGTDKTARIIDIHADPTKAVTVASHNAPIRSARFLNVPNVQQPMLATGSWDGTIQYWDLRSPQPAGKVELSGRVWVMDARHDYLVAGTSDGQLHSIDLTKPFNLEHSRGSLLNNQLRSLAIFHDASGFVISATEGRAGWLWRRGPNDDNSTFKCHRGDLRRATPALGRLRGNYEKHKLAYPVNAVSPHPKSLVISTSGGDGTFTFWNPKKRARLKSYEAPGDEVLPITATNFNRDGTRFAYAVGYDWSKGFAHSRPGKTSVYLHDVGTDCDVVTS